MIQYKKHITLLFFMSIIPTIFAQEISSLFNAKISKENLEKLHDGKTIILNVGKIKNITFTNSNNELVQKAQNFAKNISPNYLAEIIKIVPKEKNENIISRFYNTITKIESYTNIPYFSERNQKYYNLYESAVINNETGTENIKTIDYTVRMIPFGFIDMRLNIQKSENSLFCTMVNTSEVFYEFYNIPCVKPENMFTIIVIFEYEDYYILYGLGGVKAPSIFFLRERIDISFVGRIKSFCKFIFDEIDILE